MPPSPLWGCFPRHRFLEISTWLSEDDIMLLYTDGVCDSRSRGRFFGTEGIETVWQGGPCDVDTLAREICRASSRYHHPGLH